MGVLSAIVLFTAADVILQFALGADLFGNKPFPGDRLTGPLSRPNVGYFLLFIGMPVMVAGVRRGFDATQPLRARLAWTVAMLVVFTAILLTGERMVLLLCLFGLAIAAILLVRPLHRVAILFVGIGVAAALLIVALHAVFDRQITQTFHDLSQFAATEYARIWAHAFDMFQASPIFGSGLRTFRLTCALYGVNPDICDDLHPHQLYLEWLSETGLVGTLGFVALIAFLLREMRENWPGWRAQPLIAGAVAATLVRLWPITSSGSFFANWNEAIFWFLLGLSVVAVAPAKGWRGEGR
jgi:O-antigen ligase